jgi:aminopeptidase S
MPGGVPTLSFSYYLAHRNDSSADDFFRAAVVGTRTIDLSAFAGQTIRILFSARDGGVDNLLEAAVDDVKIVVR